MRLGWLDGRFADSDLPKGLSGSKVLEPLEEVDLLSGLIGVVHREVRLKGYIN